MVSAFYYLALDAQLGRRVADGVYLDSGMGGWVIGGQREGAAVGLKKTPTSLRSLQGQN